MHATTCKTPKRSHLVKWDKNVHSTKLPGMLMPRTKESHWTFQFQETISRKPHPFTTYWRRIGLVVASPVGWGAPRASRQRSATASWRWDCAPRWPTNSGHRRRVSCAIARSAAWAGCGCAKAGCRAARRRAHCDCAVLQTQINEPCSPRNSEAKENRMVGQSGHCGQHSGGSHTKRKGLEDA